MNLTVMCDDVQVKHGDVTLKGINALELVKALNTDGGLALQEVLAAIQIEKGKDWFKQATDEVME